MEKHEKPRGLKEALTRRPPATTALERIAAAEGKELAEVLGEVERAATNSERSGE